MLFSLLWLRCAALRLTLSLISVKQKGVQHLIKYSRRDRAANKRPDNIDSTAAKVVNGRKPRPHLNKSHFKRAPTALPFPFSFPFRSPQTKDLSDERDATRRTANGRCCSLRGAWLMQYLRNLSRPLKLLSIRQTATKATKFTQMNCYFSAFLLSCKWNPQSPNRSYFRYPRSNWMLSLIALILHCLYL